MQIQIPYTLAQIRAATKAQIITQITNRLQAMTKREIIIWLLENVDRVADEPVRKVRTDGQVESNIEIERDIETGEVVSTCTTAWTYYPTGEVDEITIIKDGVTKIVKHYLDGRQPEEL